MNYFTITDTKSPVLTPYPDWTSNELPVEDKTKQSDEEKNISVAEKRENILDKNNATIISTFRIRADECDRLWVISYTIVTLALFNYWY